ncbi:Protein PLM2 [Apiospora rasikravindrae]|uniref:Protein PLM2 n=1 Tax=Apiospora rasikravindrae TaxID=990691 RepID=A0ABR1TWK0_9PEZI
MSVSPVKKMAPAAEVSEPTLPALLSSPSKKRPAPSLLPPFEPLSSSPGFPRPPKRQARVGSVGANNNYLKYPTPVPTSSTGILSSSPPHVHAPRPSLVRTQSVVSERAPLSAVPSVDLSENGETLLMGRSSNSSHFQLSANRLVSRVHVKARYLPASDPLEPNKIEIICNGWNGLKLHCQGRTWELSKGDTFTSETENAEIMLDVHESRVMVRWPKRDHHDAAANLSDSSWDDSPRVRPNRQGSVADLLQSSPLRRQTRLKSPESPTPFSKSSSSIDSLLENEVGGEPVHIYEDPDADEPELPTQVVPDVDVSFAATEITNSFSSDLSELDDENDPDEENDPIVHSFGPFGANLTNRLAGITAADSPRQPSRLASGSTTAHPSIEPEEPLNVNIDVDAVKNHVINQLAYSRLSSNPLSGILNNLPSEEKKDLSKNDLRRIIESTECIGIIARQGKDAAGKPLESEYYYVPERDNDDSRRLAVTDGLRKPSLRACRKQHKQYYWKRPKTP